MISLHSRGIVFLLKVYVAIVLIIATLLAPLALSFVPILLLAGYLYLWRWPISAVINLLTEYFIFFALALLLISPVGAFFSLLIALPVLLLVHHGLEATAESVAYRASRYVRRPTDLALTLLLIATVVLGIAFLLGSLSLLLTGVVSLLYLGILGTIVFCRLPLKPVEETLVQRRIVAGKEEHLSINLTVQTKIGGRLFVELPYPWLKVGSDILSLKQSQLALKVSLAPSLSGPAVVKLRGYATDRWGLLQVKFEMDWKRSLRYNELISKEFAEFHGRSAIILVNLTVSNAEEADNLAYEIIVTAISLAQENIPAALAVYNHEVVRLTTGVLHPQHLLRRSLQVAQEMVTFINPLKYLSPPDVARLRANISRLQFAESKAAEVLAQLLQMEYKSLSDKAKLNPATMALAEVLTKVDRQSNIVIISQRNHDAEALAFNTFSFARRGNAIISLEP